MSMDRWTISRYRNSFLFRNIPFPFPASLWDCRTTRWHRRKLLASFPLRHHTLPNTETKDKRTNFSIRFDFTPILPFHLSILPWPTIPSRAKALVAPYQCCARCKAGIRRFSEIQVCWTRDTHFPTWCKSLFDFEFPSHTSSSTEIIKTCRF